MTTSNVDRLQGVEIKGKMDQGFAEILTVEALEFVKKLAIEFEEERQQLMKLRDERQAEANRGKLPEFLPETEHIRKGNWKISSVPKDLQDRRVEITGPVDRKMIINALNSGANGFMADFEDATSPTWENIVQGQINLRDAVNKTISYINPAKGKKYELNDKTATLIVRPRGWHLMEKHLLINGEPVSGGLFDFAIYFFHNAKTLIENGSGPYFYLPKLESHLEARLWNEIFVKAQEELGIPIGTIKATVLIETIFAAFEMDEILYELRDHIVGLNCGRWDYIFSYLKKFRNLPDYILPDRSVVTMTSPFMKAYSLLTIKTCHRRGAHAMGGMAAQIPVKNDEEANQKAIEKVYEDKKREATNGHDGTWVAHPALVPVAKSVFDEFMPGQNQVDKQLADIEITREDLLEIPTGPITEEGLRTNINVGIQYMEAWLRGSGAVPIHHLMEDAATAEISRAQVWQWIRHPKGVLENGQKITFELFSQYVDEELEKIKQSIGVETFEQGKFDQARQWFEELTRNEEFEDFLTISGYELLIKEGK
ncbi:malate synthase A [Fictibacillus gelatini]|uniref:malate synthase A n=1 Tax=Fictibacillus gelatini TaxID=225985 RepID=UPI000415B4CD|nr:malate synthase A [Fictibacillus gelatini]